MVRSPLVIAAFGAACLSASAAHSLPDDQALVFGAGATKSCAWWFTSPATEAEGFAWVVGFWSGLNFGQSNPDAPADVGKSTDGWGIVGEVKKLCRENPSSTPLAEALKVYRTLRDQNR